METMKQRITTGLFGPLGPMASAEYFGECLVRHNIVDAHALDDPEGYDGYQTLERIGEAYEEISQHLTARADDALQKVTDLMADIQSRKNETSPSTGATKVKS